MDQRGKLWGKHVAGRTMFPQKWRDGPLFHGEGASQKGKTIFGGRVWGGVSSAKLGEKETNTRMCTFGRKWGYLWGKGVAEIISFLRHAGMEPLF